jgi:hypothetical protein
MSAQFDIYDNLSVIQTKTNLIDTLFGYPKISTKTGIYRKVYKHPTENLWRGTVKEDLIAACDNMTPLEKEEYYDSATLVNFEYLMSNGWFAPDEEE